MNEFINGPYEPNNDAKIDDKIKQALNKRLNLLQTNTETEKDYLSYINNSICNNETSVLRQFAEKLISINLEQYVQTEFLLKIIGAYTPLESNACNEYAPVIDYADKDKGILHIVLPILIPKRIKVNEKYRFKELQRIKSSFCAGIEEWFWDRDNFCRKNNYCEKVVLVFLNHYPEEVMAKDHDNMETKPFIDAIAAYGLPGDDPKWCAHYMDYILDGENYTEIYVVPQKYFAEFFTNIKPSQG